MRMTEDYVYFSWLFVWDVGANPTFQFVWLTTNS